MTKGRWVGMAAALAAALAGGVSAQTIVPSRAHTRADLVRLPGDDWITNGGNVWNQRYSALDQINRANVAGLKGVWRYGHGVGRLDTSAEAQILEENGVLYVTNADSDVHAIDVETGKALWIYRGQADPSSGNPAGRTSRGVALGDGKVFVGHREAKIVALDQRTGKVLWTSQAEDFRHGISITSAPLYTDGLVITGYTGGDNGVRGKVNAFDARTGKLRWTFWTVPAPGEPGSETWPSYNDSWKRGGAAVWQTPAVDPELGLVYFSTGNAGADYSGADRAGDNLFTVSIVAVEAKTGKYRWHYQQVHHDIWDYDSPNPVVLFDASIDGVPRKGLVEVSKTGWAYILDRATGKPLLPIEERPVPQEPRQATAATQPYPVGDAIVPQEIPIPPEGSVLEPGTNRLPNGGRIFTPFWTDRVAIKPGTRGGANWPPSAYDPRSNLLFVCATDRITNFTVNDDPDEFTPGKLYVNGRSSPALSNDNGVLAALDVRTNRLAWRQMWKESCFSGVVATAGGLIFVGRTDGRLTALDSRDGGKLWEFMTDAGVNSTVTTFLHKGKQYVAGVAGGNTLAGGKRGDGVWLFGLDGKLGPVTAPTAPAAAAPTVAAPPGPADLAAGERTFRQACTACHGEDGKGGVGSGPDLTKGLTEAHIADITRNGRDTMPAFGTLDAAQIRDVAAYVARTLTRR